MVGTRCKPVVQIINREPREELLLRFEQDRFAAHKYLFAHRRKDESPAFHGELIGLFNTPHPQVGAEAFRGAAKSTIAEEYLTLRLLYREVKFPLIIGNTWTQACERLTVVKSELTTNDAILELYGDQQGSPWTQDEIGLINGRKVRALGAGQSMRGVKHKDERPDEVLLDDLEDEEQVSTEEARRRLEQWLYKVLLPALNPKTRRIRILGTPLHPQALLEKLRRDPSWLFKVFPIAYIDPDTGEERSSWPGRFSMDFIRQTRADYMRNGNLLEFEQEYMCRAEEVSGKPFQQNLIKVEPQPKELWTPKKAFVDPARTVKLKTSARTGYAVWDWTGNRLMVHEAYGKFQKPDEIINEIFEIDEKFQPVEIGVELTGLEEFLMQPLRAEQLRRGITLPLRGMQAPRNKREFITSLQPFYKAGEVIHAKALPELDVELLQFPTGRIDIPNALAYALKMRAGRPVYEDFTAQHIGLSMVLSHRHPVWLVMSSRPAMTAGALVQYIDGALAVHWAQVMQGPPSEMVERLVTEAIMTGGAKLSVGAPTEQFERYTNNGLVFALRKLGFMPQRLAPATLAEGKLAPWMRKQVRGVPAFMVRPEARWVVNGLAEGYARRLGADGRLVDHPDDGPYKLIIEALESFVSWFDIAQQYDNDTVPQRHYATTTDGRRYLSSRKT